MRSVSIASALCTSLETTAMRWTLRPRRAHQLGKGAICEGQPQIANNGAMSVGESLYLASAPVRTQILVGAGGRLAVGDRVSIGHGSSIHAHLSVEIGDDVLIGPFAIVMDTDHHHSADQAGDGLRAPIIIEAGARIGSHATVLRGAHIGAGAWVAAGSVVAGHVAPGARVAGNPAR